MNDISTPEKKTKTLNFNLFLHVFLIAQLTGAVEHKQTTSLQMTKNPQGVDMYYGPGRGHKENTTSRL